MTNAKKEIEELKRELAEQKVKVAALEAALPNPEPKPFVPEPYQQYDPTAGMTMPPSVLREMVRAVPDQMIRDIVRDNQAPTGRPGMIPESSHQVSNVHRGNVPGSGTGWAHEVPLGPPPGVAQADRLMDAQDQRDRAELVEREARLQATQKVTEQIKAMNKQTEALAKLTEKIK